MCKMRNSIFSGYHPFVIFLYFVGAISLTMCSTNPFFITISFLCGSLYYIYLKGAAAYMRTVKYCLLVAAFTAVINPLFNSCGLTLLFYVGGSPVTAEAVAYGISSGVMLAAVIIWFGCYSQVMTGEKFLAIFGKITPITAMMISMVLKYIPETIRKAKEIENSQKALTGCQKTTRKARFTQGVNMSSILLSWSLEDSIDTSDSMRARGYGENKRKGFVRQRLTGHDVLLLVIMALLVAVNAFIIFSAANNFVFYPLIVFPKVNFIYYIIYGVLLTFPLILQLKEQLQWTLSDFHTFPLHIHSKEKTH